MSTTRLPELPAMPQTHIMLLSDLQSGTEPGFNRGHLEQYARAYGLAVWKAAMEAAAKECERYEGEQWQKYKRGHGPERASDYCQGQSDGGGDCANAIRSLPLPEQGGPQ